MEIRRWRCRLDAYWADEQPGWVELEGEYDRSIGRPVEDRGVVVLASGSECRRQRHRLLGSHLDRQWLHVRTHRAVPAARTKRSCRVGRLHKADHTRQLCRDPREHR